MAKPRRTPRQDVKVLFDLRLLRETLEAARVEFSEVQRTVAQRGRAARLRTSEQRITDLVNQADGLSEDDIELLWRTASPRMPGFAPADRGA